MAALKSGIPFVAYSMPGTDDAVFWADDMTGIGSGKRFGIHPWLSQDCFTVYGHLSETRLLDSIASGLFGRAPVNRPWEQSTRHSDYIDAVTALVTRLKQRGGKTVYSRTVSGSIISPTTLPHAIATVMTWTSSFNAVYFHPATGAWLVASPELLLNHDEATGRFETMSLAGTRPADDSGKPWSGKNIEEQAIVTRYIAQTLKNEGIDCAIGARETITSGPVQHLRNMITGLSQLPPDKIAQALSPTPALGGFPVAEAITDITELEAHPRRCYGGYLTVQEAGTYKAFVNLRCCNFSTDSYCLYAGGGITPSSTPQDEWDETTAKLSRMLALFERQDTRIPQ